MKKSSPKKILVILGPTATGKSDLAVKIAKKFKGEIISADSRQVYKGLDIGTGKITMAEMKGIHHWLLDVVSPKKVFSVADWKKISQEKISVIHKRSKLPIICGGTGFYIKSIVDNIVLPEVVPKHKLRNELGAMSIESLQKLLKKLDRKRFETIDINNKVRLIRAIEIAKSLGNVPEIKAEKVPYEILQIGLKLEDEELKKKIHTRLLSRIKKGMIQEAEELHKKGVSFERMRELGLEYRYLAMYLQKEISKEEMISKLNTEIWHYAKRQMTWFKRDNRIKWYSPKDTRRIKKEVENFLK